VRKGRAVRDQASESVYELSSLRRTSLRQLRQQKAPPPSAFASFGDGSWLVPPMRAHNPGRIGIGRGVIVHEYSTLWVLDGAEGPDGPLLVIGDGVRLARFCSVVCEVGVTIGDRVSSSDSATITDTWRMPFSVGTSPAVPPPEPAPVVIGSGAYLAMNCIIGPGVHVGEGAYIGENAVVFDDVDPHTVVRGNPAKVVQRFDPARQTWEGRPFP
jgi:abequosyltransferase